MARKPSETEVHAYVFIKENLRAAGWDVRNPARVSAGQVYTQNECLADGEIKRFLGTQRPENIVKVTERVLWVIEAKASHAQLKDALAEAEQRARTLNQSKRFQVKFVSGVAGNELDSFLVRTRFFDGARSRPVTFNKVEATGLLRPTDARSILQSGDPNVEEPTIDVKLFLDKAEHINEILHLGAVNPHQRAGVMAALLLSMFSDTPPNIEERSPLVLIGDINGRVERVLKDQKKPEFINYIKIVPPGTTDNHAKFRTALVKTIQEMNSLNIRAAMNSGGDWLGAFYEVFLKYASWAQDLGIVLTPRHMTQWVADVMDVQMNDILCDPCCGTGGFLVAAFDYVKRGANDAQLQRFKQNSVFGVEQDGGVAALAVVNMIFRGDGKNNIVEGNTFAKFLEAAVSDGAPTAKFTDRPSANPPVTKVMMNPPFALKASDEKEYKFVDQALRNMEDGGTLFSVLPYSAMVRPGAYLRWRKDSLLANHTLLAVVTFPPDLFYPIGVVTVGIFVRKGIRHPNDQNVLWVRAVNDGLVKTKGRRLPNPRARDDLQRAKDVFKAFLRNARHPVANQPQFQKAAPIDWDDPFLELVPENYLDQPLPGKDDIRDGIEQVIRDSVASLIRAGGGHA